MIPNPFFDECLGFKKGTIERVRLTNSRGDLVGRRHGLLIGKVPGSRTRTVNDSLMQVVSNIFLLQASRRDG